MEPSFKTPPSTRKLTITLTITLFILSIITLLIVSGIQTSLNLQTWQQAISDRQQLITQNAAKTISNSFQEKFDALAMVVRLTDLSTIPPETQKQTLESLLTLQPTFRQIVLVNAQGQELVKVSRMSQVMAGEFIDRIDDDILYQVERRNQYISPVYIDATTSEPMVIIAVPVIDILGDFQGSLAAEVNLKFMWDMVDQIEVGEAGYAYVVDREGNLIAYQDVARVLKGENVSQLKEVSEFIAHPEPVDKTGASISQGINGDIVVSAYTPMGTPDWAVVTELPWAKAYQEIIRISIYVVVLLFIMAILAILVGRRLASS